MKQKTKSWLIIISIALLLLISYISLRYNYIKLGLISYLLAIVFLGSMSILEIYNIFKVEKSKQVFRRDEGSYTILGYKPFIIKFYREKNPVYFWMGILILFFPYFLVLLLITVILFVITSGRGLYVMLGFMTIIIAILLLFRAILAFKSLKKQK